MPSHADLKTAQAELAEAVEAARREGGGGVASLELLMFSIFMVLSQDQRLRVIQLIKDGGEV